MEIVVHHRISDINAEQWNALLNDNNPFMRHEFLHGLEVSRCVCEQTGWHPAHLAAYSDQSKTTLLGAMPCYIKDHSYGEYIFDWSWADAHHRHGIEYYPKLSNAIPFTPASGPRYLGSKDVITELLKFAIDVVEDKQLSGLHSLFIEQDQCPNYTDSGLLLRHSSQFHWHNRNYQDFDEFLTKLSSKKRKNIKRERRRIKESDIQYDWLSGDQLDELAVTSMYEFYQRTIHYYGAQSYLNLAFFKHLAANFSKQTLFLFAKHKEQTIAGGLYFKSNHTLYGRYWGALANFHSVHFETCYYQAIDWCIKHGYQHFEAGAQGEHKLARGLEPSKTWSAHWIRHPGFRSAIADFLKQEQDHLNNYQSQLQKHSPFKVEI